MEKLFNNLLVPVEEGTASEAVIREAVRVADQLKCRIHLLYFSQGTAEADAAVFEEIRASIRQHTADRTDKAPVLLVSRQTGSPIRCIISYYKRHNIDLILLGRKKFSFLKWLRRPGELFRRNGMVNIQLLLRKVNCPVLTINSQREKFGLRNIVLPVGDFLPMRKLLFATYLAKISQSTIHLIAAEATAGAILPEGLDRSYRLLRENTDLPVRCTTMPGENLADIAWNYAKKIKADLILVGPGKESLLSGFLHSTGWKWFRNGFSRSLFNVSGIPVMSIR